MKDYKHLYIKYKTKYLNLKNIQYGGDYSFEKLKKMYINIPKPGLYSQNISLKKFIKISEFLKKNTENDPEIKDIKRKIFLENKKLTNTKEYNQIVERIK